MDDFKRTFQFYNTSPESNINYNNVIDFCTPERFPNRIRKFDLSYAPDVPNLLGLRVVSKWAAYELLECPGLIFVRNPFINVGQRYWTARCLKDWPKRPNVTNLGRSHFKRRRDWWDESQGGHDLDLIHKLKWILLGCHCESETQSQTDPSARLPQDLVDLTNYISKMLKLENFIPEESHVDFYNIWDEKPIESVSKKNLKGPLITIGLGQTAIYLVDPKTRYDDPIPMYVRSGDIIVMNEEARLRRLAIPKFLIGRLGWKRVKEEMEKVQISKKFENGYRICRDEHYWKPFGFYLLRHKIAITVRKAVKRDETKIEESLEGDKIDSEKRKAKHKSQIKTKSKFKDEDKLKRESKLKKEPKIKKQKTKHEFVKPSTSKQKSESEEDL